MTSVAKKINHMVERLPEQKQNALLTIVQSMIDPEDFLTSEDLLDIVRSRKELDDGEVFTLDDVDWKV